MATQKLAKYRAKRDFEKTAEPRGGAVRAAAYPRFVIQKHDATRLHYDLRLEHDGVFKSWAVTRGPSLDPRDKRLAVEVEDHPLAYGDFEGTIPADEYGGGTVMLWDRGFWMPEDSTRDIAAALRKGELKFVVTGKKLNGSFVLVRMRHDRHGGSRTNWLLIKHRDDFATTPSSILDRDRSVASGRTMAQIAAGRGRGPKPFMAAGAKPAEPTAVWHSKPAAKYRERALQPAPLQAGTHRRTSPVVAMPPFIAPQLCSPVSSPPSGATWVHEIKLDGYRTQLRVEHGDARLRTRRGLDWTDRFQAIAEAAAALPDCLIDGEVVALDANGNPDFSALQAALSEGRSQDLIYFAFDVLFAGGEDLRPLPLMDRKQRLADLLGERHPARIRLLEHVTGDGEAVLQSARSMHLEGIVSKQSDKPYRSGRTAAWTKAKCRSGHEVVICGWSGSNTNLRSLVAGVYRGKTLVYVGQVGTGFNARNAPDLLAQMQAHVTRTSPFKGRTAPRRQKDWHWVKPRLVAEIAFAGWTGTGMVRQAAFKGLREDKKPRDVRAERPVAAPTARQKTAAHASEPTQKAAKIRNKPVGGAPAILGVTLSHPDKALWPAAGAAAAVTKRDLAEYLQQVGPWMIAHIEGRPCSLVRAPDGIGAQTFFQRHGMPGVSNLVALTTVSGERKPYLQIDRIEGLVAMAQIAAVEFHPWNCAPHHPDRPGRLIFDLDPAPDVAFSAVIAAAQELRARLETLGLVAFCKTTGGKGLHVVTPLRVEARGASVPWDDAKRFAQALCTHMAADDPAKYLVNMSKKQRAGRIFLDYLRNDRMATAVAPLSPRARPGAPVSMPVTWEQVRHGLDPARYTLATVPALLANSRAWHDYADAARPLKGAITKLLARKK